MEPGFESPYRYHLSSAHVAPGLPPLCEDHFMSPSLSELLKLPPGERVELAMALWESLSVAEREAGLEPTPEEAAELDRRWMDHVQQPESAIPWEEARRTLLDREWPVGSVFDPRPTRRRSKRETGTRVARRDSERPFETAWTRPLCGSLKNLCGFGVCTGDEASTARIPRSHRNTHCHNPLPVPIAAAPSLRCTVVVYKVVSYKLVN